MAMPLHDPAPRGVPSWLALGVLVRDTAARRIGVAQLFRGDLGDLNTDRPTARSTQVLLRPLDGGEPWWTHLADVTQPADSVQVG